MLGLRTGDPVSEGRLRVWPLYGPREDMGFVDDVHLTEDRDYGDVSLGTDRSGGACAPWGMLFFIPGAQDRTLRESVFVPCGQPVEVSALCVEPAECGLWEKGDKVQVATLPPSLKANIVSGHDFTDLWDDIATRYSSMGEQGDAVRGLLEGGEEVRLMVDPGARGAMVAIDDRIVALEVAPSAEQFQQWWREGGLGQVFEFESRTLPQLPTPLGTLAPIDDMDPGEDGMHQVTYLDVLTGWMYVRKGKVVFASLLEKEGLSVFKTHGHATKPNVRYHGATDPLYPETGDEFRGEW